MNKNNSLERLKLNSPHRRNQKIVDYCYGIKKMGKFVKRILDKIIKLCNSDFIRFGPVGRGRAWHGLAGQGSVWFGWVGFVAPGWH
jgi:hypothetical protein